MKKISLFVMFSLLLQSFAWAGTPASLKSIVDEYHYALTVEWDQKDQAQLSNYQAQFSKELKKLLQEKKLSVKEVQSFLKQSSRQLNVDSSALEMIKDQNGELNLERAEKMLLDHSAGVYMNGSSWAPLDILKVGIGVLIFFELVVLVINIKDDVCPTPRSYPNDVDYSCVY